MAMLFASQFNICNIFCLLNSHSDLAAHLIESLHCFGTCSLAIWSWLTRCCSLNCTGFQELPGIIGCLVIKSMPWSQCFHYECQEKEIWWESPLWEQILSNLLVWIFLIVVANGFLITHLGVYPQNHGFGLAFSYEQFATWLKVSHRSRVCVSMCRSSRGWNALSGHGYRAIWEHTFLLLTVMWNACLESGSTGLNLYMSTLLLADAPMYFYIKLLNLNISGYFTQSNNNLKHCLQLNFQFSLRV